MLLKISVRICPSFWYQMALSRVLAHGLRGRTNSTSEDIYIGNNTASPPPLLLGRCRKQKQNTDYGGKTWVAGKTEPISPRVAASLWDPMLLKGPEEGCLSGRTIVQMVRWHHAGEIQTYFLGGNIGWTRGGVPLWEDNRSDVTMTPSWRDPDLFPRVAIAFTVGQSAA